MTIDDRELDAQVAEALGWKRHEKRCGDLILMSEPGQWGAMYDQFPHYSTSDTDALAALDAVLAACPDDGVEFCRLLPSGWRATIIWYETTPEGTFRRTRERIAATRPAAICAAIIALAEQDGLRGGAK